MHPPPTDPPPEPGGPIAVRHLCTRGPLEHVADHSSHTEHVLGYHLAGRLRMECPEVVDIRPGFVTLIPAGAPHRPIAGEDVDEWVVGFCASCLVLPESDVLMSPFRRVRLGALPVVEIPQHRRGHLLAVIAELDAECGRNTPESTEVQRSLLVLILAEVRRAMGAEVATASGGPGSLVADALEVIQRRSLTPLSLRDVAAALHRTPAHVATEVKRATGYTVGEWIVSARLNEARSRLLHTDDTVEGIARHVG